jgi:hypothetical protein
MRDFDPVRLGNAETDAWAYYYRHEWGKVLRAFLVMIRVGFGLSWPSTVRGAWWVLRANQLWAPYPDNDPDGARALMRRFYALVARSSHETFDVDKAAELEVEWWRVHRLLQHSADLDPSELDDAFTALYAHVYSVPASSVREAAARRAEATRISDAWVAEGCDPASPLLARERAELVAGYTALREAVRGTGPRSDAPS